MAPWAGNRWICAGRWRAWIWKTGWRGLDLAPVLRHRMQDKLWQALYFGYDPHRPWREQLEANLLWLRGA